MRKQWGWGALIVLGIGVSWGWAQEIELAPPAAGEGRTEAGTDVLARGPVHEAFAEMISPDPEPGLIVPKAPPEPIDELPPEWKPEGDDVEWVPGYWFWDDDREDFVWVSGVWRRVPPGRRWVPGYWQAVAGGHQWTPGFWGAAEDSVVTYLDAPPESLDRGPSSPAPAEDMFWMPGAWEYHTTAYRWRPGHWHPFRADWTWVSARFIWTPRGYICIPGYWDYTLTRRGFLFAPVYFSNSVYLRPGFSYRPTFWIGADAMLLHLFVSPVGQHLYFGDYYAAHYRQRRFVPCVDYHLRHRGFASLYVYYENHYRHHGIDYCQRVRQWHDTYARRADLRPPHTYNIQLDRHRHGSNALLTDVVRPFHASGHGPQLVGGQRLVAIAGHDHELLRSETKRLRSLATERSHFELATVATGDASARIAKSQRKMATFQLPAAPKEIERSRSFKKAPPTLTFSPETLSKRTLTKEAPKTLGAEGGAAGTRQLNGHVSEAWRKRPPRLPLASDSHVDSSDAVKDSTGLSKGRSTLGNLGRGLDTLGPAADVGGGASSASGAAAEGASKGRSLRRLDSGSEILGPATSAVGGASSANGAAAEGASKGRSLRRGMSAGLDAAGSVGVQSGGTNTNSTGTLLPLSSNGARAKAQLPPAARKALTDSATRLKSVDLGGLSQGSSGSPKRIRSGADSAIRKGPAGGVGSGAQSGGGSGATKGNSGGSSRIRSGGKGKGRGVE